MIAALLGGYIKYGDSLVDFYNSVFYPADAPTADDKGGESLFDAQKIFQSDFWQSLKMYGRLPIMPRPTGRANPFVPSNQAANSPGARDAVRVNNLISIASALNSYYVVINKYPLGQAIVVGEEQARCLSPAGWLDAEACESAKVTYLEAAPRDPGGGKYLYTSDDQSYSLKIDMETAEDIEYTGGTSLK